MLEHNGKMYARVSEILQPLNSFDHINPFILSRKAEIGTIVHKAINDEILQEFPYVPKNCEGYFESFCKWKQALNPEFIETEKRYFCEDKMICGQIDALIQFPHSDLPILVDFKTSAVESPVVWPMQAHLYYYLLEKNKIPISKKYLFVKLNKMGHYPLVFQYYFDAQIQSNCMAKIRDFWLQFENL